MNLYISRAERYFEVSTSVHFDKACTVHFRYDSDPLDVARVISAMIKKSEPCNDEKKGIGGDSSWRALVRFTRPEGFFGNDFMPATIHPLPDGRWYVVWDHEMGNGHKFDSKARPHEYDWKPLPPAGQNPSGDSGDWAYSAAKALCEADFFKIVGDAHHLIRDRCQEAAGIIKMHAPKDSANPRPVSKYETMDWWKKTADEWMKLAVDRYNQLVDAQNALMVNCATEYELAEGMTWKELAELRLKKLRELGHDPMCNLPLKSDLAEANATIAMLSQQLADKKEIIRRLTT